MSDQPQPPNPGSVEEFEFFRRHAFELFTHLVTNDDVNHGDPPPVFTMVNDKGIVFALMDPDFMRDDDTKSHLECVLAVEALRNEARASAMATIIFMVASVNEQDYRKAKREGIQEHPDRQELVWVSVMQPDGEENWVAPLHREASRGVWLGDWETMGHFAERKARMQGLPDDGGVQCSSRWFPRMQVALGMVRMAHLKGWPIQPVLEKFIASQGGAFWKKVEFDQFKSWEEARK